jgi:hypothetical protein
MVFDYKAEGHCSSLDLEWEASLSMNFHHWAGSFENNLKNLEEGPGNW